MKNKEKWEPTRFVLRRGRLRASPDPKMVGISDRFLIEQVAASYEKYIAQYCRGRLADIGCGHMPLYGYYKQYCDEVTAVDWSETRHPNEHLDVVADLNCPPIPGIDAGSFETVICSDVLEHIYKPRSLLDECNRIMVEDGVLLFNVPFYFYIHEVPYDYYRYTEWALKKMLSDSGFEMLEIVPLGGIVSAWLSLTSLSLGGFGFPGKAAAAFVQYVQNGLNAFRLFHKIFYYKKERITLGYFVVARKSHLNTV